MSRAKAREIVEKYAKKLKEKNYHFSAIYLFGSYAQDKASKWSDIDVAVISDRLKKEWNKNEEILWKHTFDVDYRIEPIGFTVKDFKDNCDPMVREIKKTGIRIV